MNCKKLTFEFEFKKSTPNPVIHMASYCESLTAYQRRKSSVVKIGELMLGGDYPIRLQSMTTTDTMDTQGSVDQSIRMIEAGCELVRITAPSKKEAHNLAEIKDKLRELGYTTPLVADIHFTPNAAEVAARIVEKVRVNPGNYADKKKFEEIEYTDESYQVELERIEKKFTPLVKLCKQEGVAMRIGTNHGSLSDRIMSRYGDTPKGMVESAMEFLRICRKHDYHEIVLSMKASNTLVMVQAYRLLVAEMDKEGMDYPLHLGVTEAGDGEDGRIKSAVGIGTLLEDGLGDTVRVSLTEEPEFEIPVARKLVERYAKRREHDRIPKIDQNPIDPFVQKKRETYSISNVGSENVPVVVGDLSHREEIKASSLFGYGYAYSVPLDKWNILDQAADLLFVGDHQLDFEIPGTLGIIQSLKYWQKEKERHYPLLSIEDYKKEPVGTKMFFVEVSIADLMNKPALLSQLKQDHKAVLVLTTTNLHGMPEQRRAFIELLNQEVKCPVIVKRSYQEDDQEAFQLAAATDLGALLLDGLGDGIWLDAPKSGVPKFILGTAFGILQAARVRISKTEYISCPSCGRTLFDLQETTAKIRAVTSHLKGVKIGIMGCIVNGPGEMADADYGYVGTGPGKITLYKEKEVVQRNVPEAEAVEALIDLIAEHGDWVEAEK
ncbi:MAG: (E)-4-hydroxy-3-methylbut-2-enyl-diphosphate synthase [Vicingaceae bacterium]